MNKEETSTLEVQKPTSDLRHTMSLDEETVSNLENASLLNDLKALNRIKYRSNQYGIGNFITTVEFSDDQALITTTLGDETIKKVSLAKNKFLERLKKLNIQNWKRYYSSDQLDGNIWHLSLFFNDDQDLIKVGGNNKYPDNYKKLRKLLRIPKRKYPKVII